MISRQPGRESRASALVLLVLLVGTAFGEDVEAILKRGVELRKKGEDRAALAEFQRALAIKETPRVVAQVGLAEHALGMWLAAEAHLGRVLKQGRDPWIERNRATLEGAAATVASHLGTLEIWGEPAGAEVIVNGKSAGRLPSPGPVRVVAGACSLVVRAEGHEELSRTLQVSATTLTRENVQLVPSPAPRALPPAIVASTRPAPLPELKVGESTAPASRDGRGGVTGKWWFWTAIGAAVVGGAATAFILTRPGGGVSCPSGVVCPP